MIKREECRLAIVTRGSGFAFEWHRGEDGGEKVPSVVLSGFVRGTKEEAKAAAERALGALLKAQKGS